MHYLQKAFDEICKNAKQANGFYVTLMEHTQYYGGPEEGGWWGTDSHVVAYQYFPTGEAAQAALEAVQQLASQLECDAKTRYGEYCLSQLDWLDARGLDSSFLQENDGPTLFSVVMSEGLPEESYGTRHYE